MALHIKLDLELGYRPLEIEKINGERQKLDSRTIESRAILGDQVVFTPFCDVSVHSVANS